jgi:hypothetical protein
MNVLAVDGGTARQRRGRNLGGNAEVTQPDETQQGSGGRFLWGQGGDGRVERGGGGHEVARGRSRKRPRACLIQHPVQLVTSLPNTVPIIAIYHEDQPLCVLEVVSPQRTDLQQWRNQETGNPRELASQTYDSLLDPNFFSS